jgi:hypothetical protein
MPRSQDARVWSAAARRRFPTKTVYVCKQWADVSGQFSVVRLQLKYSNSSII